MNKLLIKYKKLTEKRDYLEEEKELLISYKNKEDYKRVIFYNLKLISIYSIVGIITTKLYSYFNYPFFVFIYIIFNIVLTSLIITTENVTELLINRINLEKKDKNNLYGLKITACFVPFSIIFLLFSSLLNSLVQYLSMVQYLKTKKETGKEKNLSEINKEINLIQKEIELNCSEILKNEIACIEVMEISKKNNRWMDLKIMIKKINQSDDEIKKNLLIKLNQKKSINNY